MDIKFNVKANCEIPLSKLKPFQGKLKKLPEENFQKLKREIVEDGFNFAPHIWICDKNHYIIDGHQRLSVMRQLVKEGYNIDLIPCNLVEAEDFDSAKRKVLQSVSQYGKVEEEGFREFTEGLDLDYGNFDLPDCDFDLITHDDNPENQGLTDEDSVPEITEEPKAKLGDIYQLGEHRIMCGDSTDKAQVDKLMNGEKADMVFTDPPYGINLNTDYLQQYKGGNPTQGRKNHTAFNVTYKKIVGDDKPFDPSFILDNFECREIFLWGANYYWEHLPNNLNSSIQVWDKRVSDGLRKMHGNQLELCWSKSKHSQNIIPITWCGAYGSDEGKGGHKKIHPTQKPVKLAEWFFEKWGKDKNLIVDLFLGSGSTLIACEKTNRRCYGMEIEPHYTDVIIKRWEDYTGGEAKIVE